MRTSGMPKLVPSPRAVAASASLACQPGVQGHDWSAVMATFGCYPNLASSSLLLARSAEMLPVQIWIGEALRPLGKSSFREDSSFACV